MSTEQRHAKMNQRRMENFLNELGLEYSNLNGPTQKYLLDYGLQYDQHSGISSIAAFSTKQLSKDVNIIQGGGPLPLEYFGQATNNYVAQPTFTETSYTANIARVGLVQSGGNSRTSGALYKYSDYAKFKKLYEQKFLRQLNISKSNQRNMIDNLNNQLSKSIINSVKQGGGNLYKTNLKRNLKI
jgi:hypothetical protein